MILFPYKKVVIETKMDQMMFLIRLKNITLEENIWSILSEITQPKGQFIFIGNTSKKIIHIRHLNRNGKQYFKCKTLKKNTSTLIELVFEVSFLNKLLTILWSIPILSLSIIYSIEYGFYYLLLIFFATIPFGYYWFYFKTGTVEVNVDKILEISEGKICKK